MTLSGPGGEVLENRHSWVSCSLTVLLKSLAWATSRVFSQDMNLSLTKYVNQDMRDDMQSLMLDVSAGIDAGVVVFLVFKLITVRHLKIPVP